MSNVSDAWLGYMELWRQWFDLCFKCWNPYLRFLGNLF
jgi:hypothetical protein